MEKQLEVNIPRRQESSAISRRAARAVRAAILILAVLVLAPRLLSIYQSARNNEASLVDRVQKCAINNLHKDLSFLDSAKPISAHEFIERRDRLAQALVASDADAFVLEPGYTFQYYGNISQTDWEPWEPEERPFLMIVMPETSSATGRVKAKTAFLSPHFEEARVRMLGIPSRDAELDVVIWEEHWNPYTTLIESRLFKDFIRQPKIMMDEEIRDFIVRGLDAAGFMTLGLDPAVELIRQQKTAAEVEVLRAVNSGTVEALRAMRPCLVPGLTENEVRDILNNALLSVGFQLFFNIVLFEEHAALPHGGFVTGSKKLTHESMILIDVGAHYLGYSSDICRSFFIDPPKSHRRCHGTGLLQVLRGVLGLKTEMRGLQGPLADPELHAEKLRVWSIVFDAQTAAAYAFRPNVTAASIDIAARTVIEDAGYGHDFTHRLGHSIGIKAHESPYLNKWNTDVLLRPGMTFTDEPGIYLLNRFGVRHEDVFLIKENGQAELLSGRRARGPYDP